MKFFDDLKADRLIEEIRTKGDVNHPDVQKALGKLARLGAGGIPKILETLPAATKQETVAFVEILTQILDNKTFPVLASALIDGDARTNAAISWALSSSRNYSPQLLLEQLSKPGVPKPIILEVISAHKQRFGLRDLLTQAYNQESADKAALFKIVGEIADDSAIPELISRIEGKDTIARTHIVAILSRFNRPDVARALQKLLKDSNKLIRQSALNGLVSGSSVSNVVSGGIFTIPMMKQLKKRPR